MDTSLAHENARLRALLQTQQDTIRQMAEYNRLLSQRVAAYASEINRLKALVAKLQRMQFGKSSEKLRAKTERQIQEAQERISALQEEMAETLGEQYDPVLPSARHCCKVSDEAAFCLIQRPYISKTLLTRRISPRGSP